MIFPDECKQIGYADRKPCGDRVYFLSMYLVRRVDGGHELVRVTLAEGATLMREILHEEVLAGPEDLAWYPEKVRLADRAGLITRAAESGRRCTVFTGLDEHITFVLDPDPGSLRTIHVYDIIPPRPSLSATIAELEEIGLFGTLRVRFVHHVRDIRDLAADIYPCQAAGFSRTLDMDPVTGGGRLAGCRTGKEIASECYGAPPVTDDICPLSGPLEEPFIARCCRKERAGIGRVRGVLGAVVHWGAGPEEVRESVAALVREIAP